MSYYRGSAFALAATLIMAQPVLSQEIKIGLSGTFTGPNATNGIPYRNAAEIFPSSIGGVAVKWILLDDATDPTTAVKNARKFIDEDKVDIVLGSTSTVTASAMMDVSVEAKTAQIALSPVQIYFAQETQVENAQWIKSARKIVTACTPLVVFTGAVDTVVSRGRVVIDAGVFTGRAGAGSFLKRSAR